MSKVLCRSDSLDSGQASIGCAEDGDYLNDDLMEMETFSDCDQLLSSSDSDEIRNNFKSEEYDGGEQTPMSGVSVSRRSSSRRVTFDPNVLMKQAILEGDFCTLRTLLYQDAMEHGHQFQLGGVSANATTTSGGRGGVGQQVSLAAAAAAADDDARTVCRFQTLLSCASVDASSDPVPVTADCDNHRREAEQCNRDVASFPPMIPTISCSVEEMCNGNANSAASSSTTIASNLRVEVRQNKSPSCNRESSISSSSSASSSSSSVSADCDMSGVPDSPLCRSPRHSGVPRVNVNATDNDGLTLLHLCCFAGAADCVRLLVERGAEVDAADEAGWTPLHVAAYEGLTDVVQTLVSAGATIEARDEEGLRPEDVACSDRIRQVFEELKAGGKSN
ncbi:uncharacterized protein LOC135809117 [Sycon ciliatum]|uniref:uncharacterized protein LOC135809117 n=1 Tax=Sycon ciliatum TaxID=27933 RepID=UPI0020AEDEDD|eukprot:scpid18673/ scgid22536/ Protein phosphatase 1 regulatory subunit 12C; Protein phosphatase 1 myosin-binding subunit of 85 kDa